MIVNPRNNSFAFVSQAGCLLPFLFIFNFVFGLLLFKPLIWIAVGGILFLLLIVQGSIFMRRIKSHIQTASGRQSSDYVHSSSNQASSDGRVIDAEAEVVDDNPPSRERLL